MAQETRTPQQGTEKTGQNQPGRESGQESGQKGTSDKDRERREERVPRQTTTE